MEHADARFYSPTDLGRLMNVDPKTIMATLRNMQRLQQNPNLDMYRQEEA